VIGAFAVQVVVSEAAQFIVDQRNQRLERFLVACSRVARISVIPLDEARSKATRPSGAHDIAGGTKSQLLKTWHFRVFCVILTQCADKYLLRG